MGGRDGQQQDGRCDIPSCVPLVVRLTYDYEVENEVFTISIFILLSSLNMEILNAGIFKRINTINMINILKVNEIISDI